MWIKICGVRDPNDAVAIVDAGADAIGLNFVPQSPRCLSLDEAIAVARAARARGPIEIVGLFVDAPDEEVASMDAVLRFDRLQLHGDESPSECASLGPRVMKALRVGSEADLSEALHYVRSGVRWLLLDALTHGPRGGTGKIIDWHLVRRLRALLEPHQNTHIVLAGGLTPDNVSQAIAVAAPDGVDTASGVERAPAVKDLAMVRRFVAAARKHV